MNLKGKIIDLSQEIYNGMPVYPGHLKTVIFTHVSHEESQRQLGTGFSYQASGILMCDHGPTHIDSISHISRSPDAPSVDEIPLEYCITPAICIDVSDVPRESQFGKDKIEAVLKTADEMGYVPSAAALSLIGKSTRTIGIAVYDFNDPF